MKSEQEISYLLLGMKVGVAWLTETAPDREEEIKMLSMKVELVEWILRD